MMLVDLAECLIQHRYLDIDNKRFCENINKTLSKNGHPIIEPQQWTKYLESEDTVLALITSNFKSGRLNEDEFIAQMLSTLNVTGKLTKEQFIDAWDSILDIRSTNIGNLKELIKELISQIREDIFFVADSNILHQRFFARAFSAAYMEVLDPKPHAIFCDKVLIRSYDIKCSSGALSEVNSEFRDKAKEYLGYLTQGPCSPRTRP